MTPVIRKTAIAALISSVVGGVIVTEGNFSNDPDDPGKATKHGITQDVALQNNYFGNMKDLPENLAYEIYIDQYVYKPNFDDVLILSPAVGEKLIDAGVNTGTSRSSLWFQKSLNSLNRNGLDYKDISTDGIIGSGTIQAFESLQEKRGQFDSCVLVLRLVDSQQGQHYMSLNHLEKFTVGWVNNRIGNVPDDKCSVSIH